MKHLQTTLFVIAFAILSTQSFRHVYVKWIEPRSSVLDAYREAVDTAIASAASLDELVALYQRAHALVEEADKDTATSEETRFERHSKEPYTTEAKLRDEVQGWESRTKQLFELRFFWSLGLLGVLLGIWCYKRANPWLGMAGIITGFSEMAYWTSPLARSWGAAPEFERLLSHKLVLSLLTWALLVTLWLALDKWGKTRSP